MQTLTDWATKNHTIFVATAQALVDNGTIPAPTTKDEAARIVAAIAQRALLASETHDPQLWEAVAGELHETLRTK